MAHRPRHCPTAWADWGLNYRAERGMREVRPQWRLAVNKSTNERLEKANGFIRTIWNVAHP